MCNLTPSRAEGRGGEQWQAPEPKGTTEVTQTTGNSNWGKAKDKISDVHFAVVSIALGEGNGPHSSTLAWKIPWTEEPGGLQAMGSLRVGHD